VAQLRDQRMALVLASGSVVGDYFGAGGYWMDYREMSCEDGRQVELAQDRVQWRVLVLVVSSQC
jgi:hypothetical protein